MPDRYGPSARTRANLEATNQPRLFDGGQSANHRDSDQEKRLRDLDRCASKYLAARALAKRGLDPAILDFVGAIGRPKTAPSATAWRIRPGSNMSVVADLLDAAGAAGVSEDEAVNELLRLGRLTDAINPRRSIHWTFTELRGRTRVVERNQDGRWHANASLFAWKSRDTQKS